jgi:hypothetical protein
MKEKTCVKCENVLSARLFNKDGVCIGCQAKERYANEDEQAKKIMKGSLVVIGCLAVVITGIISLVVIALIKYVL